MDKLKNIANDIKSGWEKIEKKKRIQLVFLVVAISVVLFVLVYFTQRTEYKVLFSELEESDAGAIVEDLETKGMDYKLEDDGTTILIDEDLVDEYRIEIAVDGPMPSTTTGFEIFDESSLMTTDEDRAIMYQRAISGELERAISSIDNVESSKVLLNIPENSVFQNPEYQKDATASVVLEMGNGQMPNSATIQGISALVSGAVENLPQENVEIVDTNGNLLTSAYGEGAHMNADAVTEHQRIKGMIEDDLEERVLSILGPVYGREKVHITVNTDLNFDAIEREVVEYGEGEHIRSQTESVTGNAALADRVQGGSLDEDTTAVVEDDGEEDNSFYEHSTNYELDTTISNIVEAPGAIERITASVVIMDHPTDRAAVQGLVENALGINNFRDPEALATDVVQIEYITPSEEDDALVIGNQDLWDNIVSWLAKNWWILVVGIVLLILIITFLRVVRNQRYEVEYDEEEYDTNYGQMNLEEEEKSEPLFDSETEEKMRKNKAANEKEDLIREQTKENPELAAELIKIWLKEDEK